MLNANALTVFGRSISLELIRQITIDKKMTIKNIALTEDEISFACTQYISEFTQYFDGSSFTTEYYVPLNVFIDWIKDKKDIKLDCCVSITSLVV